MTAFDTVGYWSEIKLDIIRDYAKEYSKILSAQANPKLHHVYIDAFAGGGVHLARSSGEFIPGSPLNALLVEPPFKQYCFIDLNEEKIESLMELAGGRPDVQIYHADCNQVLIDKIFPQVEWNSYRRGLCILDPYGLHLDWRVIQMAGQMKSLEIFLNFPVADINRNVLWRYNPEAVAPSQIKRLNSYWGDDSWRCIAYEKVATLFGDEEEKVDNETIAEAFRERLRDIAGFKYVPKPIPMRNSSGSIVYYLFFASQKPVAGKIVTYIFDKYRDKGI